MKTESQVRLFRWADMPKERVTDAISRRLVTGDRMMLAHVYLDKDAIVPKHSHENEQITYILEGALRFHLGEDGSEPPSRGRGAERRGFGGGLLRGKRLAYRSEYGAGARSPVPDACTAPRAWRQTPAHARD